MTEYVDLEGQGSGREFLASLPPGPTAEREELIVDAVRRGMARVRWTRITSTWQGMTATVPIMADALAIGSADDHVRISTTYPTAQRIADLLGNAQLMTPKVADLVQQEAVQRKRAIPALNQQWFKKIAGVVTMSLTRRIADYHALVEKEVAKLPDAGTPLIGNVGKDWVVTLRSWKDPDVKLRHNACNYGYYAPDGLFRAPDRPKVRLWQSTGLAHNMPHVDYSQLLRFMGRTLTILDPTGAAVTIDDAPPTTAATMMSAKHAPLVTGVEGALPGWRHPDLPLVTDPNAGTPGKSPMTPGKSPMRKKDAPRTASARKSRPDPR